MAKVNRDFLNAVDERFDAGACMNCGACVAVCPIDIGLLPRQLFRHVMLGLESKVLDEADTVFSCLLCKMCEAGCPAGVPIAENVRLLRRYFNDHVDGIGR